jgi:tRNA (guanine-N7-)-methyltransferase
MTELPPQRRLFGRQKGKALRAHQSELMDGLLPRLSCDLSSPFVSAAALFERPVSELRLEIGFGGGEHLIAAAAAEPDAGFIGCEPFVNGMAKLLAKIEAQKLDNIRLYRGDAGELLDWLPPDSLARAYLFYPDPWPKRRQRKRRFVNEDNILRLSRALRSGAELRFATDIDDYAGWTLARLRGRPDFAWRAATATDWLAPWNGWTQTKYESKAMAAGRKPVYLTFVRRERGFSP